MIYLTSIKSLVLKKLSGKLDRSIEFTPKGRICKNKITLHIKKFQKIFNNELEQKVKSFLALAKSKNLARSMAISGQICGQIKIEVWPRQ